jgi:CDP-paratose synthetase
VHAATDYGRTGSSSEENKKANIDFGMDIVNAAILLEAKHFINIDTAFPENINEYAESKKKFLQPAKQSINKHVGLKLTNACRYQMYGGGLSNTGFINQAIRQCEEDKRLIEMTEGLQKRDFIHIDDVVIAIRKIVDAYSELENFESIAVGTGVATTIREFMRIVIKCLRSTTKINYGVLPYRANDPMILVADISRLKKLKFQPAIALESGIRRFYK